MRARVLLGTSFVLFAIDRLFKYLAQTIPEGTVFSFFPGVQFGYFLNPALFFFPPWRLIPYLALLVLVVLAIFIATHVFKRSLSPNPYPLIPIFLGGMSNVFDRFAFGGVIDYVEILTLATLNLADILIIVGLIFTFIKTYDQRC